MSREEEPQKPSHLDKTYVDEDKPKIKKPPTFGRYQIIKKLAQGGMGVVYAAENMDLQGVKVALKVLRKGQETSPKLRKRFLREARLASRLNHPNIVRILDCGVHKGMDYIVMDFIEGEDLAKRIWREGPLDPKEALQLLYKVCGAIHYAHKLNIIHRDLKTANILLTPAGVPMVTDFGIAKDMSSDLSLTKTGAVMGSPGYMAPEQVRGEAVSRATDTYALGVILFEMLTAKLPYMANTTALVYNKILESPVPSPRKVDSQIPKSIARVCKKALAKDPEDRYPTAMAFAEDLQRCLNQGHLPPSEMSTHGGSTSRSPSKKIKKKKSLPYSSRYQAPKKKNPALVTLAILFLLANVIGLVYLAFLRDTSSATKDTEKKGETVDKEKEKIQQAKTFFEDSWKSLEKGNFKVARGEVKEALNLRPKWDRARALEGIILFHMGWKHKGREVVEQLEASSSPEARLLQALTDVQDKKFGKVQKAISVLEGKVPPVELLILKGIMAHKKDDYVGALAHFNKALEKTSSRPDLYCRKAWVHLHQKRFDDSLAAVDRGIELNPEDPHAYYLQGVAFLRSQQYQKAVESLKKALQKGKKEKNNSRDNFFAVNSFFLGKAYYYLKDYFESEKYFSQALELHPDPSYYAACYWLGLIYVKNNSLKRAKAMFRKGIKRGQSSKETISLYFNLAKIYYKSKDHKKSLQITNEGLRHNPKSPLLLLSKAKNLLLLKKYPQGVAVTTKLIEQRKYLEDAFELRGKFHYFQRQYREALTDFDQAFRYGMKCHACLERRAKLLLRYRRYTEVFPNAKRLLSSDPHCTWARYSRGIAYYKIKRYPACIKELTMTIKKSSKYPRAYYYRALAQIKLNQHEEAKKDLRYILSYSRDKNLRKQAQKLLKQISSSQ